MPVIIELLASLFCIYLILSLFTGSLTKRLWLYIRKDPPQLKPTPVITGYSLWEKSVYLDISIESLIHNKIIPSKLRPADVKIWAHYSDGNVYRVTDLKEWTWLRPLTPKEKEEIDEMVGEPERNSSDSFPVGFRYPLCTGMYYILTPAQAKRNELIDLKTREWKPEFFQKTHKEDQLNLKNQFPEKNIQHATILQAER